MDSLRQLAETHRNLRSVEKEVNKWRVDLMKKYQSKSNLDELYEYLSIWKSYKQSTMRLKHETQRFEAILSDSILSINSKLNETASTEHNSEYNEIMTNIEHIEKESEISPDPDCSAYDQSITSLTVEHSASINTIQNKSSPTQSMSAALPPPPSAPDNDQTAQTQPVASKVNTATAAPKEDNEAAEPTKEAAETVESEKKEDDQDQAVNAKKVKSRKYVYGGKGFKLFKGSPIHSSTLLYFTETCFGDRKKVIDLLKLYGHFDKDMVLSITFKTSYNLQNNEYAIVRVKGSLKSIKAKIKTFCRNYAKISSDANLSIFKARNDYRFDGVAPSKILHVANFDILGNGAHKALTQIFMTFGELNEDIVITLGRFDDPMALVTFDNIQSAKDCYQKRDELKFGDRQLMINFYHSNLHHLYQ